MRAFSFVLPAACPTGCHAFCLSVALANWLQLTQARGEADAHRATGRRALQRAWRFRRSPGTGAVTLPERVGSVPREARAQSALARGTECVPVGAPPRAGDQARVRERDRAHRAH